MTTLISRTGWAACVLSQIKLEERVSSADCVILVIWNRLVSTAVFIPWEQTIGY